MVHMQTSYVIKLMDECLVFGIMIDCFLMADIYIWVAHNRMVTSNVSHGRYHSIFISMTGWCLKLTRMSKTSSRLWQLNNNHDLRLNAINLTKHEINFLHYLTSFSWCPTLVLLITLSYIAVCPTYTKNIKILKLKLQIFTIEKHMSYITNNPDIHNWKTCLS